jgi:chromosome segregation ATPase
MSEPQKELTERVSALEETVSALPASIDRHFDAVDVSFAEMRQLVYEREEKLRTEMLAGFARIEGRFAGVDRHFARVERRFEGLEGRFERLEGRFEGLEGCFERLEGRFEGLEGRFEGLEGGFGRLERKLDQFIDTQSRTNALAERRLTRLENAQS